MGEEELYEIARQRIDKRNRRWTIWGLDLVGVSLALAAVVLLEKTAYAQLAIAVFLVWGGVFTFHTLFAAMAQSRDRAIEREVAKLCNADWDYEKPKRLGLADDGELVEYDDMEAEEAQSSRIS